MTQPVILGAAATPTGFAEFKGQADFFRIMNAGLPVDLYFYLNGKEVARSLNVSTGYGEKFDGGFDNVKVVNLGTAQTIQIVIRLGSTVVYDTPPIGNVAITNTAGAFTQAAVAVTNAAGGVQALPANASRRYLEFINTDPVANMLLRVDGGAPGAAGDIPLGPGESWQSPTLFAPTAAVKVKSDTLAATATVIEG